MDRSETEACIRVLLAVARADGTVSSDEQRALGVLADYAEAEAEIEIDLENEVRRIHSPGAKRATFEAAVALASVHGKATPEEHAVLERIRRAMRAMGGSEIPELADTEAALHEELREPLEKLAAAEVAFLHDIGKGRANGTLSEERYASMVAELRTKRETILREALTTHRVNRRA